MDIVRNRLVELGFFDEKLGNEPWSDHVYKWENKPERGRVDYVWITSGSNWVFKIEIAGYGRETGDEGYPRMCVFYGYLQPKTALSDLDVLLRTTGVYRTTTNSENNFYRSNPNIKR